MRPGAGQHPSVSNRETGVTAWTTCCDVSGQQAERLRRTGYITVGGQGVLSKDSYIAADKIESVEGDTVLVRVDHL